MKKEAVSRWYAPGRPRLGSAGGVNAWSVVGGGPSEPWEAADEGAGWCGMTVVEDVVRVSPVKSRR
jgi:hypothetical protein